MKTHELRKIVFGGKIGYGRDNPTEKLEIQNGFPIDMYQDRKEHGRIE